MLSLIMRDLGISPRTYPFQGVGGSGNRPISHDRRNAGGKGRTQGKPCCRKTRMNAGQGPEAGREKKKKGHLSPAERGDYAKETTVTGGPKSGV